eukprot:796952-Karenia_brevis.AAC.2
MQDVTMHDNMNHDVNIPPPKYVGGDDNGNDPLGDGENDSDAELQFFKAMNGDPFDDTPFSPHQFEVDVQLVKDENDEWEQDAA